MLTLTFPHMGNVYVSIGAFLDEIGVRYVVPPFNSKRTLEKGVAAVPEGACLPLKITVGALIEACEQGADAIVMASALGPCRFGYYCPMQKELLAEAGYDVRAIHFVPPRADFWGLVRNVRVIKGKANLPRFVSALLRGAALAHRVDELERLYYRVAPRETRHGSAEQVYKGFLRQALSTRGLIAMRALVERTIDSLRALPQDENARPLTISHWLDFVASRALRKNAHGSYAEAAKPYLNSPIGGHALETIGHSVQFARERFDGIIQIYPLGCMPEIVAQSLLGALSARENIPVLTLVLDEQTGEAGILTRVEAFIDLLERRRAAREISLNPKPERRIV